MINQAEKYIETDDLSKATRAVMQSFGISMTYQVTSIRAEAITNLQKHSVSSEQDDMFTHHSDTTSTVRQYYDKNNNVDAREVLGQTEEEFDNEEDEEQERTLLEKIEHETSNVEQRLLSPVGTPTELMDNQKAQLDAVNAEEVARFLDSFNIGRINKQSKISLSLQEVVYNPEQYKQSSGRDMSSSFVSAHQDVPTIGNLGQTKSSE
ncbi:MAG: hypothetical protein EZS28_041504, partial [Streblomastix strix]